MCEKVNYTESIHDFGFFNIIDINYPINCQRFDYIQCCGLLQGTSTHNTGNTA